ncbi:MAG TPA: tetratricopeptide repeat protein [Candidatus Dormibacteraeota bacterium]|jgi:tetratricopeptide (TPR) repeat protein
MQLDGSAEELLAAGTEAMYEAAFRTGDYEDAEAMLNAALRGAEADGDRAVEAGTLDALAWLMHFRVLDRNREGADPDAEEALFQRSLDIRRELGDQAGTAASLFGLALVHQVLRRDSAAAIPYLREATELADAHASALLRSECHRHVGFHHLVADVRPEEAVRHFRRSLELRHEWGDPRWIPSGTLVLGFAELAAGRRAEGVELIRLAARQASEAGLSARRVHEAEDWVRRAEAGETPFAR